MTRAIDLLLKPADDASTTVRAYTYLPTERVYSDMAESVYLHLEGRRCSFSAQLTSDEAGVLANQLLQVADVADEQRAARVADDELQDSFDEISEQLRDADERGGGTGVFYAHPDVHYVPADQVHAKAQELHAAGVKRFMVMPEPTFGQAAEVQP